MYLLKARDQNNQDVDEYVESLREADVLATRWLSWEFTCVRLVNDLGDLVEDYS